MTKRAGRSLGAFNWLYDGFQERLLKTGFLSSADTNIVSGLAELRSEPEPSPSLYQAYIEYQASRRGNILVLVLNDLL